MEKQYFKCYELFYKIGKDLPQDLKAQYYDALMEYGLYWTLPTDPIIKSLMQWPMFSIDKSDELSEAKSEYMKWNKNATKDRDKLTNHIKTEKNREKQTQTEKNTWSNKKNIEVIEDIEDNRSNKKNNIIKNKYLDFVYLASDEYEKLTQQLGKKQTDELIEKLNNYIWSTWKKYKSHYFTLLNRAKKETPTATNYEKEKILERHRAMINEQINSFTSQSKQNAATPNQEGWYNRRDDIELG